MQELNLLEMESSDFKTSGNFILEFKTVRY